MKSFFLELSRRKVIRVSAAYGIVGWMVLQVVSLLAPELDLPNWTVALVFVLLLAGYPVALILSWAFETTPDGIRRTEVDNTSSKDIDRLDVALLAVMLVFAAISGLGIVASPPPVPASTEIAQAPVKPSRLAIAVLPFSDLSPEGDQEWFSDGISEEIIHRLVQERELTVAGRTSSFYFKDRSVPFEEIGKLLKVGTVLEGSVRKFENRIRITAQLIDIESGAHRWSGTYDRELEDVFEIQDELSSSIATELLREMGLSPTVTSSTAYQPNLEAYQLYLKGQRLRQNPTYEATVEAVRLFREAADLDDEYVAPLVSLLALLAWYEGNLLVDDDLYNADAIVGEAMLRDPAPVEIASLKAHAAIRKWRFAEAEEHFREFVELVDTVRARGSLGIFLTHTGRALEAIPLIEAALEKSPLNGVLQVWLAASYNGAGRYADTLAYIAQVNASEFPAPGAIEIPAISAALALKDRERLVQAVEAVALLLGVPSDGYFLIRMDEDKDALAAYRQGMETYYEQFGGREPLMALAETSMVLGESAAALNWTGKAIDAKAFSLRLAMSEPHSEFVQFLLSSPDGRALVERAGYDLAWYAHVMPEEAGAE